MPRIIVLTAIALGGCRPAEAPEDYEALVGFIFEHADDEDDAELVAGLDNLAVWLQGSNLETAQEGVTIDSLPASAVDQLAGHDHSVEGLSGVSLASSSSYRSGVLMEALTQYSFATMMPDVYLTYDRDFESGQDCIVSRDCLWAEGSVYSVADWGILGEVEADRRIEFRWIETEAGWVFLQRWWLLEPSTGSRLSLRIGDQYYIGVNLPMSGGTRRVHASWLTMQMSTGDASTGAANQLIDNWKKDAESLDAWIAENL
ncbi:MAG: hypothetical protein VX265_01545 [Myxococcota bacterium]|nr:hypothetical protein [Myxococcota bacterium]MEC8425734.1 hypothetical protein [Myxococcota bacterium]